MAAIYFHLQERRAWVRTCTHTVVQDDEPEYARFARNTDGTIQRVLRIWAAEQRQSRPFLRAYLGSITLCRTGPSLRDLRRVFRGAAEAAGASGRSSKEVWAELAALLRRYWCEHRVTSAPAT